MNLREIHEGLYGFLRKGKASDNVSVAHTLDVLPFHLEEWFPCRLGNVPKGATDLVVWKFFLEELECWLHNVVVVCRDCIIRCLDLLLEKLGNERDSGAYLTTCTLDLADECLQVLLIGGDQAYYVSEFRKLSTVPCTLSVISSPQSVIDSRRITAGSRTIPNTRDNEDRPRRGHVKSNC